jgi:RNA polymerase sigma-70 factor (ECF subfamily)
MQEPSISASLQVRGEDAWHGENARLAALVSAARNGSIVAFEELYERTGRWLLAEVRKFVRDGQAEDVLAEVFLQVWKSLHRFEPGRAPAGAWLKMIARSRALDHLRREKVHAPANDGHAFADDEADGGDGPEQLLSRAEDHRLLHLSLSARRLSSDERMVLGLAYFRDSTQQEIASITGLPLGSVKTIMGRAQDKLRTHMVDLTSPPTPRPVPGGIS